MGSAKVSNATQSTMAETEKKSIKKLLRELFKIDKKKEKIAQPANVEPDKTTSTQVVENILEKIKKLDIKEQAHESEDEDEFKNFTFKTVSVDNLRADRSQSHSSEDSGFAEKYVPDLEEGKEKERDDDITVPFEKLNLKDGKREKRLQTVVIARGPIRHKGDSNRQTGPYSVQTDTCRQIQINKHTLTGGQVIVNPRNVDFLEFDNALKQVQQTSEQSHHEYGGEWLNIVSEYIREDSLKNSNEGNNMLSEFLQSEELQSNCENIILTPPHQAPEISQPNPIEEFTNHIQNELFGDVSDLTILNELADIPDNQNQYFLTPPHSVNAYSPMSDSASYKNSDYTYSPGRSSILSPERSSPICSGDYEKFQEISPYEDTSGACKKSVERKDSGSSMTLKQYKDLQREITHSFSKKDCCLLERTTCKQIFLEYLQRLSQEQRKNMCLKVAKLDLNNAYGVLQNILISLSQSNEMEDLQCALFRLVCERVLAQKPDWFVDDFGLNLLKSAALRCHHRPELTRCLVHCVRNAIKHDSALVQGRESVFHEVSHLKFNRLKKNEVPKVDCMFFVCLLRDYSANYESIFIIIFLMNCL
ncbi:unnamed protein product [Diatraea saccharalis]|uniref:Uncharacterized protein n=1 Tax=Diatraea saccharalis TaxID=40085 RepID=A0A9P0G2Z2_9NEOP|nr:unnamed protein product [Diatraea saccharalis]